VRRKGDAEIQVLALLLFIASAAQWAYMIGAPQQFEEAIERQTRDGESMVKSGTVRAHMENQYIRASLVDAAYQGMYTQGKDGFGPWGPGTVPEWAEARPQFDASVNDQVQNNYIGALQTGGGCSLNGNQRVAMAFEDEELSEPPITTYSVDNPAPLHVECQAAARATDFGGGRAAFVKELIAVPESRDANRMRYRAMHDVIATFARSDEFQNANADTVELSSNYVEEISAEEFAGNCDNGGSGPADENCDHISEATVPLPSFDTVKPAAEDAQAVVAAGNLQDELDTLASGYPTSLNSEYAGLELEPEVVEVDYTIDDSRQVTDDDTEQDGFRITDCGETCYDREEDSDSCPNPSCTCDPDPCPSTVCSMSGSWNAYTRGGDLWTDDPWTTASASTPTDTSLYNWERNHYGGPVAETVTSQSWTTRPAFSHGSSSSDDEDDCDPCHCEEVNRADNDVYQTTRRVWEIQQLTSTVTVQLTVTDTNNRIPTDEGFMHPVYDVVFVQEQTYDFSGSPDIQTG
jgi:hypothetical protein